MRAASARHREGLRLQSEMKDKSDRLNATLSRLAAAEAALVSVLACVKRHGPFDGIFGFSQGAAVAMALLQEDVFEALRPPVEGGGAAALAPLRALSWRTGRAHAPPSQAEAAGMTGKAKRHHNT